ncbi:hypothetical protein CFC21_000749 [Triticum aestivum]|uniref:Uncharacterized protein n=2 Tax=Triticum TaxID=4564 RepID=A0A9R0US79_TRITD|nr:hypothetical protein CFC21_000749 [Triticum aestivum]VAH01597.1 unnamed protein product [Triticum turgidum subsp. durum]
MVLSIAISNFTFIAPNFWNKTIASSVQLFLQNPPRTILYVEMLTAVPLSIISLNNFFAAIVAPA